MKRTNGPRAISPGPNCAAPAFGASEDLVQSWLPDIIAGFVENHPLVDLEFTIALSNTLINRFDAGELDLVLCKRWPGEERGDLIWRDKLVWVGAEKEPKLLHEQAPREGMPALGELEFVMLRSRRSSLAPVAELSAAIRAKGEKF